MIAGPSKSLFMSIVVGHSVGLTTIFVPLFLVVFMAKHGLWPLYSVVVIPIVAVLQGIMLGGLISLGLWLVSMVKPSWVQR